MADGAGAQGGCADAAARAMGAGSITPLRPRGVRERAVPPGVLWVLVRLLGVTLSAPSVAYPRFLDARVSPAAVDPEKKNLIFRSARTVLEVEILSKIPK